MSEGGASVKKSTFAIVFFVSLLIVTVGVAQSSSDSERPVWKMELIKVKPGMFGPTLGYLDDDWMRVREEAKRQGAVLNYHRIAEQENQQNDGKIVLLTEYKNPTVANDADKLFASIRKQLANKTSGILRPLEQKDLYEIVSTHVFQDYSDTSTPRWRELARN
jgi:hypothetical protein